jgi:hypothetical protein
MVALVVLVSLVSLTSVLALTITPPSPTPGQPITLSGPNVDGNVEVFTGSGCTGTLVFSSATFVASSYTVTVPGQPAGQYSASVEEDTSSCVNFTVQAASPIPEYPFGLAVLAIFMIIAYGVTRRRTRSDET